MDQLISVLTSIAAAAGIVLVAFVGANWLLDQAPKRYRLFCTITGGAIGAIVGAIANSGGWFLGGPLWPLGGAALGALVGGLLVSRKLPTAERRRRFVAKSRPVVFLFPALIFLAITLVIPAIRTAYLSLLNARSTEFVGLDNYQAVLTDGRIFTLENAGAIFTSRLFLIAVVIVVVIVAYLLIRNAKTKRGIDIGAPLPVVGFSTATLLFLLAVMGALSAVIWNNLFWVVFVVGISTVLGLAIAALADRAKGENIAKSLIFMPMAISFVGASVIWRFVYAFVPAGGEQIGLLNAIWVFFGGQPQTWIQDQPYNNLFLMFIMIWIQTGFAMVILSAAIKAVPTELLEAAKVDGASGGQIFWRVTMPQIRTTIAVVVTTLIITVLKVYDIVKVMTNGEFGTEVIANRMYDESFINRDFGRGSALAILLFVAVLPIMYINVRRMRKEEA